MSIISRPLQFVGLTLETNIQLQIFRFEAGVFGDTSQHLRPNLILIMESEHYIGPAGTGKNLVRTGFTFDAPSYAEGRREHA